jgi:hypothetical protein
MTLAGFIVAAMGLYAASAEGVVPRKDQTAEPPAEKESSSVEADCAEVPEQESSSAAETQPAAEEPAASPPQVEIYIPSVTGLVEAARQSRTADIYQGLSGLVRPPVDEGSEEQLDFAALLKLLDQIKSWPDTSLAMVVYPQDEDGRPRWAVRFDWSLEELRQQVERLLTDEAAAKILENLDLTQGEDGVWKIEVPDAVLAVLMPAGDGSMVTSAADVIVPDEIFGLRARATTSKGDDESEPQASADAGGEDRPARRRDSFVVYCRLNLEAGGDAGWFSRNISIFKDVRYAASVDSARMWSERVSVRWNPLVGMATKTAVKKVKRPLEHPRASLVLAAFDMGSGMVLDALAGLPEGTIGRRARSEIGVSVAAGRGFMPLPDIFYQVHVRNREKTIEAIREYLVEDRKERREEDRAIAWFEQEVDGAPVFWHDPTADRSYGLAPFTYRTVIFFDTQGADDAGGRLIVCQTSMWADDAVSHWKALTGSQRRRVNMPDSDRVDWQARIRWKPIYEIVRPYLVLTASMTEEASPLASVEELADALADSVINIRIQYAGLDVRHTGPFPFGAAYVPMVAATALSSGGDPRSEAARQRVACQHLRVLYHHARLFHKDYGRWPATVAELDGYVDFASHPHLLHLRPPDRGLMGVLRVVRPTTTTTDREENEIDDSLYEIEWSHNDWKLKFRKDHFRDLETIYIDAEGHIHRVPKSDASSADEKVAAAKHAEK